MFLNYFEIILKLTIVLMMMGFVFLGSNQPMSMIMTMILITFSFMYFIYIKISSMWYSYLIMLVILSGVMVVFTYMASLAPNEKFDVWWVSLVLLVCVGSGGWFITGVSSGGYESLVMWSGMYLVMNLMMILFLMGVMFMSVWVVEWWAGSVRV